MRVVTPRAVGLADVYDIDFGRRTEDRHLWRELCADAVGGRVVEVGCGDGRVARLVAESPVRPARWLGIDVDRAMVDRFDRRRPPQMVCSSVCGDALAAETWERVVQDESDLADLVVIPYSTLFLFPHAAQVEVLRHCGRAVRPGGVVAAECFVPEHVESGTRRASVRVADPDPLARRPWVRHTRLDVDAAHRTTRVLRTYGPPLGAGGVEPVLELSETVYWREPASLAAAAVEAGLGPAVLCSGGAVPPGHVLLKAGC